MSPPPASAPSPRRRRSARTAGLTAAALAGALACATEATAGWTPPEPLPGTALDVVTGASPGQVAFVGQAPGGAGQALVHAPGAAGFTVVPLAIPTGPSTEFGANGAVSWRVVDDADDTHQYVGTVDASGRLTVLADRVVSEDNYSADDPPAAAGDGTAALGFVEDGRPQVLVARPGAAPIVHGDLTGRAPGSPSVGPGGVSVAPRAGGGYHAVWDQTETDDDDVTNPSRISGASVPSGPGSPGAPRPLATGFPDNTLLQDLTAVAGVPAPAAAWTESISAGGFVPTQTRVRFGSPAPGSPRTRLLLDTGPNTVGIETRPFPDGSVFVALSEAVTGAPVVQRSFVVPPGTAPECTVPVGVPDYGIVGTAAGVAAIGTGADGTLLRQDARPDCGVASPVSGPRIPGAAVQAGGVDAQGTLAVAVEAGVQTLVTADDRTGPALGPLPAPSRVAAGSPFTVALPATDAWGLGAPAWTLDGSSLGGEDPVRVPGLTAGAHRLAVVASDRAGNTTPGAADIEATADTPPVVDPPPAAPTPPTPAAPDPPATPIAPPVDVPLPAGRPEPRPGDPSVRFRSVRKTTRGFVLRVRVRNASRLRLTLARERYLGPGQVKRRLTCPRRPAPARRPPTGLRGRTTLTVDGTAVSLLIPRPLADALTKRGRYTLSMSAYGRGSKRRVASDVVRHAFTVC
jgi:hypothetical protein